MDDAQGERLKISIRSRRVVISKRLRAHVERRVGLTLARFGDRISLASVQFVANQGESATICRIDVRLRPSVIRVQDARDDLYAAVDYTARRAARSVARLLEIEGEPK